MTSPPPTDDEIIGFWSWFAKVADDFGRDLLCRTIHDELSARLEQLGEIAWEAGPGSAKKYMLAISPDGDPELLSLTQRIVSLAPQISGWEFLPARAPRSESLVFVLRGSSRGDLPIDAESWRYSLYKYSDGMLDIVVEQRGLDGVSSDDRYTAAVVVLDALLGEQERLSRIHDVEAVASLSLEQAEKSNSIRVLPSHLVKLLARSQG